MNYLLDTHTFIWAITEKKQLSAPVRRTLEDNSNHIFVSAISFWEISLKYALGKLTISGFTPEELPALATASGFDLLPLSPADSCTYHLLPTHPHHKDPFDKMLIQQAINQRLTLISKDKHMAQYAATGLKILW